MKKITSTALLAIRLTWVPALFFTLAGAAAEAISVYRWLMPGGVPLQATFGFEALLSSAAEPYGKLFAVILLVFLALRAGASKGSKTIYTMNRLGLSEEQTTMVFGGVFSLYFLLYWAIQLGLCYGFFVWYTRFGLVSSNAWMLACWRSEWLHLLLPLGEWWNYLRNLLVCLSFGFTAAFGSRQMRRGTFPLGVLILPLLCTFLLTGRVGETAPSIGDMILLPVNTIGYWIALKGGTEDEDL